MPLPKTIRRPKTPLEPGRYVLTSWGNLYPLSRHTRMRAVAIVTVKAKPARGAIVIESPPTTSGVAVPSFVPGQKLSLADAPSGMEALAETWRGA